MTGSLQTKNGKYYVVARIPDGVGGEKQKWISTGIPTEGNNKRKAQQKMRQILAELESAQIVYSTETLFVDWIDKWMEQKKREVRLNTLEGYQIYLEKHIKPYFQPLKLTVGKVTPQHIQDYYNKKLDEGQSACTLKKHKAVIRGSLQDALRKNLIPYNPADRTTLPKSEKFKGTAYSLEQANQLLRAIDGDTLKPVIILGLFYGLRKSEALGLRWRDVDFEHGTIKICNTVTRLKTLIEHEQTKSKASERTLVLIPETKGYLQRLMRQQIENRLLMGASYEVSDHICVRADGKLFSPDYVSQHFKRFLVRQKLPQIRFHDLRHTAGSLLMEHGMSIKQIQEFLGHENPSTTMDIYLHSSLHSKQEVAGVMDHVLKIGVC